MVKTFRSSNCAPASAMCRRKDPRSARPSHRPTAPPRRDAACRPPSPPGLAVAGSVCRSVTELTKRVVMIGRKFPQVVNPLSLLGLQTCCALIDRCEQLSARESRRPAICYLGKAFLAHRPDLIRHSMKNTTAIYQGDANWHSIAHSLNSLMVQKCIVRGTSFPGHDTSTVGC